MRSTTSLTTILLLSLAGSRAFATSSNSCKYRTNLANHQIRAPLPNQPTMQLKLPFLNQHILFYTTITNTLLSESSIASFCLDQCVSYMANASAGPLPEDNSPASYTTNKPGPCLSFTVDQGQPYPPDPEDTALRWYCEGFDVRLREDLGNYEMINGTVDSYKFAMAVNRDCEGEYRAF